MSALEKFYPIVDSGAWVGRLVGVGAKFIQLRIKDATEDRLRLEMHHAVTICRRSGAELVVNDHWEFAIDAGADWIHLGQGDLDEADVDAIRANSIRLGVSTHSLEELDRALAFDPDYVALGSIFPTILKAMPFEPQGLERIGEWKKLIGDRPLVAIGGLNIERAEQCLAHGADSVAVVTDITLNADPEARAAQWLEMTQRAS
jgi:thiamine-phosphate pyrophosphorylase